MKKFISFLFFIICSEIYSQEMNCQIVINSDLVDQTNQQIFKTLENSLNEFINFNVWTNKSILINEKISCSFIINLSSYNSSNFVGTLQVQSQRPIHNSNYDSPIFNLLDKDISFKYQEFEPLFYNPNSYQSNLISLVSFYIYIILGIQADSFENFSGTTYYNEAFRILNFSQKSNLKGWNQSDGKRNRFWLIDSLLSNAYIEFRSILYSYHHLGLDLMVENTRVGKNNIIKSLNSFESLYARRPNSYLIQVFFDAKSNEIVDIFSEGPKVEFSNTINVLNNVAPFFSHQWKKIKY